ncbi:MAG: toxin-antitoxin system YwqK family antitoxin [Opitutae bacterium]|mgnify:FL=1|jgi:antitoxin component YwqK of YwqJK toxin-antitoxin module|nr:toxin-antitoxin system YwqK family antitoxin [Opitutae bacterium]MBT5909585.1 toxin-antitoxin system YwqK family antitoxin [Opitutae bacterium]MBT6852626.1 toxin-antitoxin system YwqK family antitoxin [Opitutae bacterium]MBT7741658.1 toxin-antitoxin system YwqK family antitoxin [Opitutae bacterium]MBT7922818.1 toxin-antitoxin system YwqK family antitoxin [Opitutae bacterium]
MKKLLAAIFVALLMVGCGDVTVDVEDLEYRNGVKYLPNEKTPFTGKAESFYENGQKKGEVNFKDGKEDGLFRWWGENGQKEAEGTYKEGKEDGLWTFWYENGQKKWEWNYKDGKLWTAIGWKPNGEKCPESNIKDWNGVWVLYDDDGTVSHRRTYKDGELVED